MLTSAIFDEKKLSLFKEMFCDKKAYIELEAGVYASNLNFHIFLDLPKDDSYFIEYKWTEKYQQNYFPDECIFDPKMPCYGVCDSVEQWKEHYKHLIENPKVKSFVAFTEIRKDEQPSDGGWRWHKWGRYIGNHKPQYEYLYDEKDVESVLVYHVYVLPWKDEK